MTAAILKLSAAILLANSCPALASKVFYEQQFNDTDWTMTCFYGNTGQVARQVPTGGNSGGHSDSFREVTTITSSDTYNAHLRSDWIVNPGATPIAFVSFSIDFKNFNSFGQGQGFCVVAHQSGKYYVARLSISGSSNFGWQTMTAPRLKAADFGTISNPNDHPNFVSGTAVTFGFGTGNTGGNGIVVGYDNLRIMVRTVSLLSPGG